MISTPAAGPNNVFDTALIFEGGGMRASYTSAVVTTLLEAGIYFDWVAGISAGSSNAVNYISRDPLRARRSFVEFADDPRFGGWVSFLRGRGFFDAEYIYQGTSAPGQVLPFDFGTFTTNRAQMNLGVFEADTGRSFYWTKADTPTLDDLLIRVRSSSSMPVLMPLVHLDGHCYADGALGPSGGIALDAAKQAGFTRFFVVLTRPRDFVRRPTRLTWALRAIFRDYPAIAEAVAARPAHYNRTRQELLDLEAEGRAMLFFPDQLSAINMERRVSVLAENHRRGLAQARAQVPSWRDWLGLS